MNKKIKLGQFFTPKKIVELTYKIIKRNNIKYDKISDTSGGYGDFIKNGEEDIFIYVDIDEKNCNYVKKKYLNVKVINKNSLLDVERVDIANKNEKLLIIGNPPYNNFSSFYKKGEKGLLKIRDELKSRDLGISFLKSYNLIAADYVCVLHPLSYLIKETNFKSLKEFKKNYKLIDCEIISSNIFKDTSKKTHFPIIIGLYKKDKMGMDYQTIKRFTFPIFDTKYKFSLNQFLYIEDVHTKYKDKTIKR